MGEGVESHHEKVSKDHEKIWENAKNSLARLASEITKTGKYMKTGEALPDKEKALVEPPKTKEQLAATIKVKTGEEREMAIREAITKENIPEFQKVKTTMKGEDGKPHEVVFSITKDCLNLNGIRMPMTPETAQLIARKFDCMLPTKEMMDAVLSDAAFKKVVMPTLPPGPEMDSTAYYERHDRMIREQMAGAGIQEGEAVIGHSKIIIIGPELAAHPENLLFHGGMKSDGTLWQNNDLAHDPKYADYSHGIMLVSRKISVDGQEMDMLDAIKKYPGLIGKGADFNPFAFYQTKTPLGLATAPEISAASPEAAPVAPKTAPVPPPLEAPQELPVTAPVKPGTPVSPLDEVVIPAPPPPEAPLTLPKTPITPSAEEISPRLAGPESITPQMGPALAGSASAVVSAIPVEPTQTSTPKESRESREKRPIDGSTFFAGDSNMVNISSVGAVEVKGSTKVLAGVSRSSSWLLGEIQKLKPDEIKQYKNFVCLIGTNDIGDAISAEGIFENIKKICEIAAKNGLKVYLCTVPPFKGWGNYASNYEKINAKRQELNKLIMNYGKSGPIAGRGRVIELHNLVSSDHDVKDQTLDRKYDRGDSLHLKEKPFAELLQKEIAQS